MTPEQAIERLARLVARARRQLWGSMRERLQPHGLTVFGFQVLKSLLRHGPLNQLELARRIEQHPAGMSRLQAELEKRKLVTRQRDPADVRRLLVAITPRGAALVERLKPHLSLGFAEVFARLTAAERAQLDALLVKLLGDEADLSAPSHAPKKEIAWPSKRSGSASAKTAATRATSRGKRAPKGRSPASSSSRRRGASTSTSRT